MPGPQFLIIGAARSGTTALFQYLAEHPGLFLTEPKEPHYFALAGSTPAFTGPGDRQTINRLAVPDREAYLRLYRDARPDQVRGEASVSTMYYPEAVTRVREMVPDARLVCMLRDPVDRAFSAYGFMRTRGWEPCETFEEALADEPRRIAEGWHHIWHYAAMSRYGEQLRHVREVFPREQLLVLRHGDMTADPDAVLARVYAHIGVRAGPPHRRPRPAPLRRAPQPVPRPGGQHAPPAEEAALPRRADVAASAPAPADRRPQHRAGQLPARDPARPGGDVRPRPRPARAGHRPGRDGVARSPSRGRRAADDRLRRTPVHDPAAARPHRRGQDGARVRPRAARRRLRADPRARRRPQDRPEHPARRRGPRRPDRAGAAARAAVGPPPGPLPGRPGAPRRRALRHRGQPARPRAGPARRRPRRRARGCSWCRTSTTSGAPPAGRPEAAQLPGGRRPGDHAGGLHLRRRARRDDRLRRAGRAHRRAAQRDRRDPAGPADRRGAGPAAGGDGRRRGATSCCSTWAGWTRRRARTSCSRRSAA